MSENSIVIIQLEISWFETKNLKPENLKSLKPVENHIVPRTLFFAKNINGRLFGKLKLFQKKSPKNSKGDPLVSFIFANKKIRAQCIQQKLMNKTFERNSSVFKPNFVPYNPGWNCLNF